LANSKRGHDPEKWLREHSITDFDGLAFPEPNRPKAALISLVRNEELDGTLQSMRQLEYYFNRRHNYPWVFFSEVPFSEEFKV
jgi:alpha 1,2-mannosyltransferase